MDEELDIPRYKPENHFAYTNLELAERKKALRDIERDYSTLPYAWLEMLYDWHKHTPEQKVKEIINGGLWEGPGKFSKPVGNSNEFDEIKPRHRNVRGLDPNAN